MRLNGLRYKVLAVVAAGLLLLFAVQFIAARLVLLEGYSRLERDKTLTKVGSAVSLLEEQSRQLDSITADWAHWDDTYQYMVEPGQNYIDSNYTDDTFDNLNVNAFLLVDTSGGIVFERGLEDGQPWRIPDTIVRAASKGARITCQVSSGLLKVSSSFPPSMCALAVTQGANAAAR